MCRRDDQICQDDIFGRQVNNRQFPLKNLLTQCSVLFVEPSTSLDKTMPKHVIKLYLARQVVLHVFCSEMLNKQ